MSHLRLGSKTIDFIALGTDGRSFTDGIQEIVDKYNMELGTAHIFKDDEYPFVKQIKDIMKNGSVGKPVYQFDYTSPSGRVLNTIPSQVFIEEEVDIKTQGDEEPLLTPINIGYSDGIGGVYLYLSERD